MSEDQVSFLAPNGYVKPCPHREKCAAYLVEDGVSADGSTYTRGCGGKVYWCKRFDKENGK